jgi:hypothetical protein
VCRVSFEEFFAFFESRGVVNVENMPVISIVGFIVPPEQINYHLGTNFPDRLKNEGKYFLDITKKYGFDVAVLMYNPVCRESFFQPEYFHVTQIVSSYSLALRCHARFGGII